MRYILVLPFVALFLVSCWSDHRVALANVGPAGWEPGEAVTAGYDNADTLSLYDIFLMVRCTENISAQDIPLSLETVSPDSLVFAERISIPVKGGERILQRGFFEFEIPYRGNVLLDKKGRYDFIFTLPATAAPVMGVTAVGVVFRGADGKE